MRHDYSAKLNNVLIRPLDRGDIQQLRIWRNDAVQTKFLRKLPFITPEMQQKWFENYLRDDSIITFAIDETDELKRMVGSLALYDFSAEQCEIGKIQVGDSAAHGRGIAKTALYLASKIGFEKLGLSMIFAHVNKDNISSHKSFTAIGYSVTENNDDIDKLVVTNDDLHLF